MRPHGLWRTMTRPSRYIHPWIAAVCVLLLGLSFTGFVVCVASGRWIGASVNFMIFVVYLVLTYVHWPWRRGE